MNGLVRILSVAIFVAQVSSQLDCDDDYGTENITLASSIRSYGKGEGSCFTALAPDFLVIPNSIFRSHTKTAMRKWNYEQRLKDAISIQTNSLRKIVSNSMRDLCDGKREFFRWIKKHLQLWKCLAQKALTNKVSYTYIHTYIPTYMHACMHACIHTYIHIYKHTSVLIYKNVT